MEESLLASGSMRAGILVNRKQASENNLRAKLEDTRIECVRYLELIPSAKIVAEGAVLARPSKLGMVPGVEALGSELKP